VDLDMAGRPKSRKNAVSWERKELADMEDIIFAGKIIDGKIVH
jgi:hypothetical protein